MNLKHIKLFESHKDFSELESLLLSEGGDRVIDTFEEDLDALLERGEFHHPEDFDYQILKMNPSQCHQNSVSFYKNFINDVDEDGLRNNSEEEIEIVTGWALSDNGMWVQHTWVMLLIDNILIETTEERDMYYGIYLRGEELIKFIDENE